MSSIPSQGTPPSPASSTSPPSIDQTHFTNSQNLYLVTFLATLFLLLTVSCVIILRSYLLRRRYQRRLEEALGSGLLLAPRAQGSKRKRLGAKPKMINAWLTEGGVEWNQMMPLSAQPVFVKRKIKETPVVKPNAVQPSTTVTTGGGTNPSFPLTGARSSNLFSRFRRSPSGSNADETRETPSGPTPNYRIRVEMLQLSMLIAMPSPNRKDHMLEKTEEEAEDELPNLVFGVTRVNYRQPKSASSPTLPPQLPIPTVHQTNEVP